MPNHTLSSYTVCAVLSLLMYSSAYAQLRTADIDSSVGFSINGIHPDGRLGFYVSHIGDINADGLDDISVCAPWAVPDTINETGEVYIIFGHNNLTDTTFDLNTLNGQNGFKVRGVNEEDRLGYGGAQAAGDINNDGIDDLIITTPYTDPEPDSLNTGSAYIIFGKSDTFPANINLETLDNTTGLTLNGTNYWDNFGTIGGAAGDINNDGIDDFFVTADDTDFNGLSSGTVYVIYGKEIFPDTLDVDTLHLEHGFLINGKNATDNVGIAANRLEDINGDGINDLAVGAFHANNDTGAGYVIFGRNNNFEDTINVGDLDGSEGFTLLGQTPGDRNGIAIGDAGDINNDGIHDVYISASRKTVNNVAFAGCTYIIYGQPHHASTIYLDNINTDIGFRINGSEPVQFSGNSVQGLGDVNQDGLDDLLIGAFFSSKGKNRNGATYIVFGRNRNFPKQVYLDQMPGDESLTIIEDAAFARLGFRVGGGGDFNGDGINDFIIGADYGTGFTPGSPGKAYVIYGSPRLSIDTACQQKNYTALRALYLNTDGDNWLNNTGWPNADFFNANTDHPDTVALDNWHGITTDTLGKCVINVDLTNNNLTGYIPPEIGLLDDLKTFLLLDSNLLGGTIPTEITNLYDLDYLNLASNQLEGNIPSFGSDHSLRALNLSNNLLTGSIPESIGRLNNLIFLNLKDNDLSGCYPLELSGLCEQLSLSVFDFYIGSGNNFTADWNRFCNYEEGACCASSILLENDIFSNSYEASNKIIINSNIPSVNTFELKAGETIKMGINFSISSETDFSARIGACN